MNKMKTIYHGSKNIIRHPVFGAGNPHNDYGLGFYCTEDEDLAKEWAVSRERDGYANQYCLDMQGLSLLDLTLPEYSVLTWITILLQNRVFDIQSDFGDEAKHYLTAHFLLEYERYDILIGYRADDSYFSYAQDFLNNMISIKQLTSAMYLGNLGQQIVLKSKRAFDKIHFEKEIPASYRTWYPKKEARDQKARSEYFNHRNEAWHKGEIYMMQVLEEEMMPDDIRLRPDLFRESKNDAGMDV